MHVRTPSIGTLGGLQTAPAVVAGPRREWRTPKPMMNGLKKSDEAVRPVRVANKGARASAESPEERASTKGNPDRQSTRRTQCRASVPQAAARIRKAAERNPKERLTALFHHITPDALHRAFHALNPESPSGADGTQSTLPACADMLSLIALSSDVISASGTTLMDSMTPIFRRRISSMFK